MTESGKTADSNQRVKGIISKPIVYGNFARYFGEKREEDGHTHQWTVYLRPYFVEDIDWIKKVHFKLHESYQNQNRVITKPPFEVTETGWGEFEIIMKVYFTDPAERPVTIYHILKLFETDPISKRINVKKTLCSEFYDEIIFQDPSPIMYEALTASNQSSTGNMVVGRHDTDFEDKKKKTLSAIINAHNKVRHEISDLKDRLKKSQDAIAKYREEISKAESKQPALQS